MKIKSTPAKRIKYNMFNRRFKGFSQIVINNGTYARHFRTPELFSAAKEAMTKATFAGPLDMRNYLSGLVNGFESNITTVPMMQEVFLPNGIKIAPQSDDFIDS